MTVATDPVRLAELLPGRWVVVATNLPLLLDGERIAPTLEFRVVSSDPLVLEDDLDFATPDGGRDSIRGVDRWRRDHFVWRQRGLRRLVSGRWGIGGVLDSGDVLSVRVDRSRVSPGGIDIVRREGVDVDDIRALVAAHAAELGLEPEDFATLGWL